MNHKITLTTAEVLVINKALRLDMGNLVDDEISARIIDKMNEVVAHDLRKQKQPTDLTDKCGSCKWARPRSTHCLIDCTCPDKRPNFFARTNKACKKYVKAD